jgi:hypothetical protein
MSEQCVDGYRTAPSEISLLNSAGFTQTLEVGSVCAFLNCCDVGETSVGEGRLTHGLF